jgi:WD40 repeat protein
LILVILAGAGIAVAMVVSRPGGFVPEAFVLEQTLPVGREDRPVHAAFIPGNASVIYGAQWRPITIFDLATGTKRELSSDPSFGNIALSADGTSAAILMPGPGPATTEMRIFDLASGKVRKTLPDRRGSLCWTWSPDGRRIVFAVSWMLFIVDLERGETQNVPMTENHSDNVNSLAFSPDGQLLGVGTWYGEVSLWRTDSWTLIQKFDLGSGPDPRPGPNGMAHVAFNRDGTLFAAGGGAFYGTLDGSPGIYSGALRVWRTSDRTVVLSMDPGLPVVSMSFSSDGATLAYSTWRRVQIVDLATGKEICHLQRPTGRNLMVEFGLNGRLMTLDERNGLQIWKRVP